MRKLIGGALICLVAFLFLAKIGLERHLELTSGPEASSGEVVYWLAKSYPEEAVLGGLAVGLGFKEAVCDFFFLQTIQYFGSWTEDREEVYRKTYPLLRAMGAISPHFVTGYSFAALVMEETGHVDEAIAFLDEGIKNNPQAFELWIYRDFMIRLFKTHEYDKAIEGIKKAIQLEGHPPVLERILAFAYEKNGQIKQAILQWRKVFLETRDSRVREIALKNMQRLLRILTQPGKR